MKRIVSLILAFVLVLGLSACGNAGSGSVSQASGKTGENKGVPQKQVEDDCLGSDRGDYTVTNLTHNIDSALHRDEVTLKFYRNYKYMRTDFTCTSVYQYDRSSDLWTRISSGDINRSFVLFDNLKNTRWTGTDASSGYTVYYDIIVDAINTSNGWICFSYDIQFAGKEYRGTAQMEYGNLHTEVEYLFSIVFDPDEGIRAYRS